MKRRGQRTNDRIQDHPAVQDIEGIEQQKQRLTGTCGSHDCGRPVRASSSRPISYSSITSRQCVRKAFKRSSGLNCWVASTRRRSASWLSFDFTPLYFSRGPGEADCLSFQPRTTPRLLHVRGRPRHEYFMCSQLKLRLRFLMRAIDLLRISQGSPLASGSTIQVIPSLAGSNICEKLILSQP